MGRKEKFINFGEDVDGIICITLYTGSGKGEKINMGVWEEWKKLEISFVVLGKASLLPIHSKVVRLC